MCCLPSETRHVVKTWRPGMNLPPPSIFLLHFHEQHELFQTITFLHVLYPPHMMFLRSAKRPWLRIVTLRGHGCTLAASSRNCSHAMAWPPPNHPARAGDLLPVLTNFSQLVVLTSILVFCFLSFRAVHAVLHLVVAAVAVVEGHDGCHVPEHRT